MPEKAPKSFMPENLSRLLRHARLVNFLSGKNVGKGSISRTQLDLYFTFASLKLNKSESLVFPANLTAWRHSMLPNKEY